MDPEEYDALVEAILARQKAVAVGKNADSVILSNFVPGISVIFDPAKRRSRVGLFQQKVRQYIVKKVGDVHKLFLPAAKPADMEKKHSRGQLEDREVVTRMNLKQKIIELHRPSAVDPTIKAGIHEGINKVVANFNKRYYIPKKGKGQGDGGVSRMIAELVRDCEQCQETTPAPVQVKPVAMRIFMKNERWNIDLTEPTESDGFPPDPSKCTRCFIIYNKEIKV